MLRSQRIMRNPSAKKISFYSFYAHTKMPSRGFIEGFVKLVILFRLMILSSFYARELMNTIKQKHLMTRRKYYILSSRDFQIPLLQTCCLAMRILRQKDGEALSLALKKQRGDIQIAFSGKMMSGKIKHGHTVKCVSIKNR